jgi:ATP adenylyltransferase/5',5'''-P-1,P-4-tetraphosphate phosphorylase II
VAGFIVNCASIIKTITDILYTGRKTTINGSLETVEKDIITFLIGLVKQSTRYEMSEFWR